MISRALTRVGTPAAIAAIVLGILALRAVGRDSEAMSWDRQAIVAEAALGMGQFSEPEVIEVRDLARDLADAFTVGGLSSQRLDEAQRRHTVTWAWIKGHAGHPENERADELARGGMAPFKPAKVAG